MPPQPSITQIRLNNITKCLAATATSLEVLADGLKEPYMEVISLATKSLLKNVETIKQNKEQCIKLLEQTHDLLNAILVTHIKLVAGPDLPPSVLTHIAKFTETLRKIGTFIQAQQKGSKIKRLFRQGELSTLLKTCKEGLQQGLEAFQVRQLISQFRYIEPGDQINMGTIMKDIVDIQKESEERHKEVLQLLETLSDAGSEQASTISRMFSGPHNSSTSITMLPSEPKIFHGRNSELLKILQLFSEGIPRIAILGAGGIGKTTVARAALHHTEIISRFEQHRYFVACDSATTKVELAALIGAHVGLKPVKDLTRAVVQYFFNSPPSLLILDNLETVWEPMESRHGVEEFLSLLADVKHHALIIAMRGAERPSKVAWTRPFLAPLNPLEEDAALQMFLDIADDMHNGEEVNKVLAFTDNMPLAISLLAHLADAEGCSTVLSRWEEEKTSMVSEGHDKRSNLELSISLSLASPRLKAFPHSLKLLSLLSMLPNGLTDVELLQSNLPLANILGCKAILISTSLAYNDSNKRLKVLVPIQEYMMKVHPPKDDLIRSLRIYFQKLLGFYREYQETSMASSIVVRLSSNMTNIQNILANGLQPENPDLVDCIYCICDLSRFSRLTAHGAVTLMRQIPNVFPLPSDHRLHAYFAIELLDSKHHSFIGDVDTVITQGLEHVEQCNDPDLQCSFYLSLADVNMDLKHDLPAALNHGQIVVSLANSAGNTKRHSQALSRIAWANWHLGSYSQAQVYAKESQRLARITAELYEEAQGLHVEATCCHSVGNYSQSLSNCSRARGLLAACRMSYSRFDTAIMNCQAEVHELKSEYTEARSIHSRICEQPIQDPYVSSLGLLNIAGIDVFIGNPAVDVQRHVDAAKMYFSTTSHKVCLAWCDAIWAHLLLREGDLVTAKALFLECINSSVTNASIISYCLEHLSSTSQWDSSSDTWHWPTICLAHSLKHKEKLLIHKALLSLGQVFHNQATEDTAMSLFNVALEGFTYMDVHRSRGECMLHLGDIYKGRGDLLRAVKLWDTARPLFERSSQRKQVKKIDGRLASVGKDLLEKHRASLAYLAKLNAPLGTIEVQEDDLSDNKDMDAVEEDGPPVGALVVA
ncbi:hypothetical protein C8R47DRAFT_1199568 [Mycena vitilis]|nr:hypothetical protein C8R47DRAFT_1199568 [Mycena vitilis]